jgi:two-component sensor histidine kinase
MQKDPLGECYILNISNTGKPFPADVSLEKPESLGLQIISTLVQQIDGTIELQKTPNPKFTIRFPLEE